MNYNKRVQVIVKDASLDKDADWEAIKSGLKKFLTNDDWKYKLGRGAAGAGLGWLGSRAMGLGPIGSMLMAAGGGGLGYGSNAIRDWVKPFFSEKTDPDTK